MWRRVTRGLVLAVLASLAVPVLLAQTTETRGALDFPDPTVTQTGVILVKGWFLSPEAISKVAVYVDDQFIANSNTNLPRFNMPLELGLFLGAKRFGRAEQRLKTCLILDIERYRYQKFISDIAGQDIAAHNGEVGKAIGCVRDWLSNAMSKAIRIPGGKIGRASCRERV